MSNIIEIQNSNHLGDSIINFIFFYKIKDYIESNDIIIKYYCHGKYHKNLLEFKCSDNIIILDWQDKGYVLWQGSNTAKLHYVEDYLCGMFNNFLINHNIPISVDSFEYQDIDLQKRFAELNDNHKNIDILIINSQPLSGQYNNYSKGEWDDFIIKLTEKYKIATSEYVNSNIISLHDMSVKNIAALALNVKKIIAINTGPSIPLYNTDILNNVENIYLFTNNYDNFKTRKIQIMQNLQEIYHLL
jgi:hypothetical protein